MKWYGYAGHFIGADKCAFHLSTRVGKFLVSTVGDFRPGGREAEPLGAGPDTMFETFVFSCDGEDNDGNPNVTSWCAIDSQRYATSREAGAGHYAFLKKYGSKKQ